MGLHVTSIAQIADKTSNIEGVDYFVYVLNYYQIEDEIITALMSEIPNMQAQFAELGNAVVITGVRNMDFADDVLSWHNVVGLKAEDVCPAILICTLPPHHFLSSEEPMAVKDNQPWILLEIGKLCSSANELKILLQGIVADISKGSPLSNFEASDSVQYGDRPIIRGKLKYLGVELDHKALFKKAKRLFQRNATKKIIETE